MAINNRDDVDRFHDYGINFTSSTIYIGADENGEIDSSVAAQFIKNIILLESARKEEITVIINTPGGCVESGLAIYDAIRASKAHINGIVYRAESMGSIILQACDHKSIVPNGRIMIHKGSLGFNSEHAKTVYKWIEQAKKDDRTCEAILLKTIKKKKPKYTKKNLDTLLDFDTYLSPKQSLELGLVDEILQIEEE